MVLLKWYKTILYPALKLWQMILPVLGRGRL
jgi:hypothetical protein